ncbi:MAG TPA: LEA type 2 family protein [Opitutaceae bacterium]|nr:LEA type 2 family protein [Opitutaceae bacterium]
MNFSKWHSAVLICFAALMPGCVNSPQLTGLSARVTAIRIDNITEAHTKLLLTIRYDNENIIPVGISRAVHKLSLNGTYIGQGIGTQALGFPPTSNASQEIVIVIDNRALAAQLPALLISGRLTYRLESEFTVPTYGADHRIKHVKEGVIEL